MYRIVKMSAFKQLISDAVNKLYSLHKRYDDAEVFCIDLFKILDNEEVEVGNGAPDGYVEPPEPVEMSTQTEEVPEAKKPETLKEPPKEPPKPKLTKEQKEAEKKAKEEAKVAAAAAKEAEKAKKEAEKKAAIAAKEEAAAVAAAAKKAKEEAAAAAAAEKAAKASAPKPEAKKAEAKEKPKVNLPKLNPTQNKLFKKVAGEYDGSDHTIQKAFLDTMNKLSHEQFNAKKLEEHMKEFVATLPPSEPLVAPAEPAVAEVPTAPTAPVETAEEECVVVDYKGKEYSVSSNGTVYEEIMTADGEPVYKKVGMVGMAHFKDLKIPEE